MTNIAIDRTPPGQDQIDKALEQKYNESFTTKNGANVDYTSAIRLVYRYCSSLSKDMFTVLAPDWNHTQHENGFLMTLLLPIQSPLNEIITVSQIFDHFYHFNCFKCDMVMFEHY